MFWPQRHHCKGARPACAAGSLLRPVLIACLAALVLSCGGVGGSGSSGLSERIAIRTALGTKSCANATVVDFCPTDIPDVTANGEEIYTPIEAGTTAECFELDESGEDLLCEFGFTFIPSNFDANTDFLLAARLYESDDPWIVGTESDLFDVPNDPDPLASNEAPLDPLIFGEDDVQLAFAIIDRGAAAAQGAAGAAAAVGELPETVDELSELGIDLAFVPEPLRTVFLPLPDEDLAFATALSQQNCVDAGVFFACPNDVSFPPTDPEPSIGLPLFFFDSEVNIVDTPPFDCVSDGAGHCSFNLRFRIDGLVEYYYQAAARVMSAAAPGLWRIGDEVMDPEEDPELAREFDVPVSVELPPETPVDQPDFSLPVQIVLLPDPIVLDPSPLVDILSLSVGFEAFVSENMDIRILSSTPAPSARRGADSERRGTGTSGSEAGGNSGLESMDSAAGKRGRPPSRRPSPWDNRGRRRGRVDTVR